ncbi:MAG TPA: lipoate--protein ligase family protein, partial [Clostridia bacterium]|nr:lipoate--protein ligase family protein [Clostridia bacterium]
MNLKIILTAITDPHQNLAFEEYLFETADEDTATMYLWTNASTVVIGRNQNPWRECKVELLEKDGGKLSRRTTGGGAVYHDLGNLNFSFIMSKEAYSVQRQLGVIIEAVRSLGIDAEFSGRNDILACGRKFSGNAFAVRKNGALHHGTLLINADMDMLTHYLTVSEK